MDYQTFHYGAALARLQINLARSHRADDAALYRSARTEPDEDGQADAADPVDSRQPACEASADCAAPLAPGMPSTPATRRGRHRGARRRLIGGWPWHAA